jgi:hypothetical protein
MNNCGYHFFTCNDSKGGISCPDISRQNGYDIITSRYRLAAVRRPPRQNIEAVIFWRRDG